MIALDTNIVSTIFGSKPTKLPSDELYIPYVVMAELQAGIAAGSNLAKNQPVLERFFNDTNITTSPGLSPDMLPFYIEIYRYLRRNGTPVSPNDLWIAAECMYLSMPLRTLDNDFQRIPQIILQ